MTCTSGDDQSYPTWTCTECAERYGGKYPPGHISSWHMDTCDVCSSFKEVTEPRDFGYPKFPTRKGK